MRRRKYSTEIKLEIVQRYMEGDISQKELANEYGVASKADIQKWVAAYREHGMESLSQERRIYTGEFKVSVIDYMYETNSSIRFTAAHFNIPSPTLVRDWKIKYDKLGRDTFLCECNAKEPKMNPKRTNASKRTEKELLNEIEYLRMENEYLKKLNALIQKQENAMKKPELLS